MTEKSSLPSGKEVAWLWVWHAVIVGVALWQHFITVQALAVVLLCAMLAFVTGARVERYRNELQLQVDDWEGDDGAD